MGLGQVTFNWFVVGRNAPVIPYEKLIEDYDENKDEAGFDRMMVDEFLTQDEVEELSDYLLKFHNLDIYTEEIALPIKSGGISYELLLLSGCKNFYILADEDEYNLSVPILGYLNLEGENFSNSLSYKDLPIGTSFLEKVLEYLNIGGIEEKDWITVLNEIHKQTGYSVQQSETKLYRTNSRTSILS